MRLRRLLWPAIVALALTAAAPAHGAAREVRSGALAATVSDQPFSIVFRQRGGQTLVARASSPGAKVAVTPAGEGGIAVELTAPAGQGSTRIEFASPAGERFYGFGERSDAVERSGRETENYVSDGPVRPEDHSYVKASVPPWADRERADSTYYPVPWLLSSRGYGVSIDEDATSRFVTAGGGRWSASVDGARLRLRVFAGPTPAAALGRYTAAVGRQRAPRAPWAFGPWFQTGQPNVVPVEEERAITAAQRRAGAPVSVAETQMHYLPCGAHKGREAAERERTDSFHRDGLARLVYFNPLLCASYSSVFGRAAAAGVLQRGPLGEPFTYPAFVGGSGPLGFTQEPLAQFDFTHPAAVGFYADLVREAVDGGADGWMEDFGESTPPAVRQHDGSTGDAAHNRYPTDYHCALQRVADSFGRPLVRFLRSGWTGTARCAEVVWGGDPSTVWGFDGISSAVNQMLSIGMSGVARWGSDIGGYVSFGGGVSSKPGATEDETADARTADALDRAGRAVAGDAHQALGHRDPVVRASAGVRPGPAARVAADDRASPPAQPIPARRRRRAPRHGRADSAPPVAGVAGLRQRPGGARPVPARARSARGPRDRAGQALAVAVAASRPVDRLVAIGQLRRPARLLSAGAAAAAGRQPYGRAARRPSASRRCCCAPGRSCRCSAPTWTRCRLTAARRVWCAWPTAPTGCACSPSRADARRSRLPDGGGAASYERRRGGRWLLKLRMRRRTLFTVEASLGSLRRPFRPRRVRVNGRRLSRGRWTYDRKTRRLRVRARARRVTLDVRRR